MLDRKDRHKAVGNIERFLQHMLVYDLLPAKQKLIRLQSEDTLTFWQE